MSGQLLDDLAVDLVRHMIREFYIRIANELENDADGHKEVRQNQMKDLEDDLARVSKTRTISLNRRLKAHKLALAFSYLATEVGRKNVRGTENELQQVEKLKQQIVFDN